MCQRIAVSDGGGHRTLPVCLMGPWPVLGDLSVEWWVRPSATVRSLGRGLGKSLSTGVGIGGDCSAQVFPQWWQWLFGKAII